MKFQLEYMHWKTNNISGSLFIFCITDQLGEVLFGALFFFCKCISVNIKIPPTLRLCSYFVWHVMQICYTCILLVIVHNLAVLLDKCCTWWSVQLASKEYHIKNKDGMDQNGYVTILKKTYPRVSFLFFPIVLICFCARILLLLRPRKERNKLLMLSNIEKRSTT